MTVRGWKRLGRAARLASMFGLLAIVMSAAGEAAELRGNLVDADTQRAPQGTRVDVACTSEGFNQGQPVSGDGNYSVRGIPSNASCTLRVSVGDKQSEPIDFTTDQPVVRFNGVLRVIKGKVIVLRKG